METMKVVQLTTYAKTFQEGLTLDAATTMEIMMLLMIDSNILVQITAAVILTSIVTVEMESASLRLTEAVRMTRTVLWMNTAT